MQRIRFIKATEKYGKDSIITVPPEEAAHWISEKAAVDFKEIPSFGGPDEKPPEPVKMKRVRFPEDYRAAGIKGLPDALYPKETAMHLPEKTADELVKRGAAEHYPIPSFGDTVPNKMMGRQDAKVK